MKCQTTGCGNPASYRTHTENDPNVVLPICGFCANTAKDLGLPVQKLKKPRP